MSKYIFLFDLDSTITKQEILPTVSRNMGLYEEMVKLTECTMSGEIPFKQSFLQRVDWLKREPVSVVCRQIGEIPLNEEIVKFIQKNKDRCYIVTGNLDVWIDELLKKIGLENNVFCSKALVKDDYIHDIVSIIDKGLVTSQMIVPFVAIGDGNNDAEMIEAAEIGIGYGGVRAVAPSVLECATHAIYNEKKLVEFLNRLL